ncbi:MAG: phosphoglucosamine mutase [Saprospiraceae bacterium]|nr:phosphoglucosamine mutase [Saprospiraceae bacterium]
MAIISSVSGIRGTVGGDPATNLSPQKIIAYLGAYSRLLLQKNPRPKVVLGRDGRLSGEMLNALAEGYLLSMGIDVIQTGYSTTPTLEMDVIQTRADGGIMLSASHNPKEWNALKLLNNQGEFISEEVGNWIRSQIDMDIEKYPTVDQLGQSITKSDSLQNHVEAIINHPLVATEAIRERKFKISADCINSTGALALPVLFDALNIEYKLLNANSFGEFAHNPEPLEEHLSELMSLTQTGFDLGVAVDPDVDRLALIDEQGNYFGEEYSLVAVADYVLDKRPGNTVSNLSSSRALRDLTISKGGNYFASAVGEVHVVKKMKEVDAVIGGEGNGGIILPDLHYGRDALIGIALILTNLCSKNCSLSMLKKSYTSYKMQKDKLVLDEKVNFKELIPFLSEKYSGASINLEDGMKIDFEEGWLHIRKSNTEPIIRIYSEAKTANEALAYVENLKQLINLFKS